MAPARRLIDAGAAVALGASLIADRAALGWQKGLADRLTVQVLPPEQGAISIGADESGQVVAYSDKCQRNGAVNIEVNTSLGQQHYGNDPKRNQDEKGQVAPGIENPKPV